MTKQHIRPARALGIIAALFLLTSCASRDFSVSGDAATTTDDAGPISFGDGGDAMCAASCSRDLREIIDCKNVVTTCPTDQGCANGACVPACEAAAAAKGSVGCDYEVATPESYSNGRRPPCFAVFVANTWPTDTKVTVSRDGTDFDVAQFGRIATAGQPESSWPAVPTNGIPPGQVAVLFLSHDPSSVAAGVPLTCPVPPAISQDFGTTLPGSGDLFDVTGRGQAWHITASNPVTSYDIVPYGGGKSHTESAELLYPTTVWGTNYSGILPPASVGGVPSSKNGPQWGQVTAIQDGTQVTVFPPVDLPGGNQGGAVSPAPANTQTVFTLDAGEYIQWQWVFPVMGDDAQMTGTIFQSTKPISFTGGQAFASYFGATANPSGAGGPASPHQQIMPISAWGSEYVGMPFATRLASNAEESIPYRIIGAVDGTTLKFAPASGGSVSGPSSVNAAQAVDFEAVGPFVVTSQDNNHPFYFSQMMTLNVNGPVRSGCGDIGPCVLGGGQYVNMLPAAQFMNRYVFFTDMTFATTNLVFLRVRVNDGFKDVNLDCAGTLTGWKPVGANYEIVNVDLIRAKIKNGTCDNGPHTASSDAPFGLMVWGVDSYTSYAYPAGGNAGAINTVVVPPN